MPRPRTVLDDLPLRRRVLAKGSIALAQVIDHIAAKKIGGVGHVLISYANLGDQLRMMNVVSRYSLPERWIDVICNTGTRDAFKLYPCVGDVTQHGSQGAGGLRVAVSQLLSLRARYAKAIVPQPFVTQPLAATLARVLSSTRIVNGGDYGADSVALVGATWRDVYEHFFSSILGYGPIFDRPQIRPDLRHSERPHNAAVVHFLAGGHSKRISEPTIDTILRSLYERSLDVFVLGGEQDRALLSRWKEKYRLQVLCGAPLEEVARVLAKSRLFVGVDSSMMNLADAVGTPSVILYGPTNPKVTGPFYVPSWCVVPRLSSGVLGVETMTSWAGTSSQPTEPEIANAIDSSLAS